MAWRRIGDKPLSEPMLTDLLVHIYGSRGDELIDYFTEVSSHLVWSGQMCCWYSSVLGRVGSAGVLWLYSDKRFVKWVLFVGNARQRTDSFGIKLTEMPHWNDHAFNYTHNVQQSYSLCMYIKNVKVIWICKNVVTIVLIYWYVILYDLDFCKIWRASHFNISHFSCDSQTAWYKHMYI